MNIKKGDKVVMLTGKDRGKRGKVIRAFPHKNQIIVERVNQKKKHQRPRKTGQKGETITITLPVDASNALLYCENCKRGVRVGMKFVGDSKTRVCKRCTTVLVPASRS